MLNREMGALDYHCMFITIGRVRPVSSSNGERELPHIHTINWDIEVCIRHVEYGIANWIHDVGAHEIHKLLAA